MSLGGSASSSKQSSESQRSAFDYQQANTMLDAQQQGNQQALIDQFFGSGAVQGAQQFGQQIGGYGDQLRSDLQGQIGSIAPQIGQLQQMQQNTAQGLQGFVEQNNPYLNSQLQQFGQNIGQNLRENILPAIGGNFQGAGQRGSGRQGVAEGMAAQSAQRQFSQGAQNLLSQGFQNQQQAATAMAQLGGQAGGQAANLMQLQQQGLLGQQANMPGMVQGQLNAQLQPFQIGAGVIGAPSLLSSSFGFGTEQGTASSKGKSMSASLGVGL